MIDSAKIVSNFKPNEYSIRLNSYMNKICGQKNLKSEVWANSAGCFLCCSEVFYN